MDILKIDLVSDMLFPSYDLELVKALKKIYRISNLFIKINENENLNGMKILTDWFEYLKFLKIIHIEIA